jgi:hypothetical protein
MITVGPIDANNNGSLKSVASPPRRPIKKMIAITLTILLGLADAVVAVITFHNLLGLRTDRLKEYVRCELVQCIIL